MSDVSWSSLNNLDVTTIATDPSAYVRAVFLKKDWNHLLQLTFDVPYADEVLKALKVPFVRKQLFLDSTADSVLTFLAQVKSVIQKQVLLILVENFAKLPVALTVGHTLLQSASNYPWAQPLSNYVLSLQSEDFYRAFLKGEAVGVTGRLTADRLIPLPLLLSRVSIGTTVVDHYIEAISIKNTVEAAASVTALQQFRPLWKIDSGAGQRLKAAVQAYQPTLSAMNLAAGLFNAGIADNLGFPASTFFSWGLIDDDFVVKRYLLDPLVAEASLPQAKQELTLALALIVTQQHPPFSNLLSTLRSIWLEEPESALGQAWKRVEDSRGFAFWQQAVTSSNVALYGQLVMLYQSQPNLVTISSTQFVNLSTELIRRVLDHKPVLLKVDPVRYTHLVTSLLQAVLATGYCYGPQMWQSVQPDAILLSNNLTLFPTALTDELVLESVVEPTGVKPLNPALAQQAASVPLMVSLLVRDLKTLATVIDFGRPKAVSDEFGFVDEFSLNFPALASSAERKAEPWTGSIHAFERALIKKRLLQHTAAQTAETAFQLYRIFVLKVLRVASETDNKKLSLQAVGVHFRFCRFLLGKVSAELQTANVNRLMNMIVHPLILSVGARVSDSFANDLFNSLIIHFPIAGMPSPLYSVVHRLLYSATVTGLENGETVAASLVTLSLDRLFHGLLPGLVSGIGSCGYSVIDSTLPWTNEEGRRALSKATTDAQSRVIIPAKFRDLVLRHYFSKKTAMPPRVNSSTPVVAATVIAQFGPSPLVIAAVIDFLAKRLESYTDDKFQQESTALTSLLISILKTIVPASVPLAIKAPQPTKLDRFIATHTLAEYQAIIGLFKVNLGLSRALVPVLQSYTELAALPLFSGILRTLRSDDSYAKFQKVLTFAPLNPAIIEVQKLPPYAERKVPDYTPHFTVSVVIDPAVSVRLPQVLPGHQQPPKPAQTKADKFSATIANIFVAPILTLDSAQFIANAADPQSFLNFATFAATTVGSVGSLSRLLSPAADLSLFGRILSVVLADLTLLDPEPTQENPSPAAAPILFAPGTIFPAPKVEGKAPVPALRAQRGRRRRGFAQAAPRVPVVVTGKFTANKFILAMVIGSLRRAGLVDRLDFDLFADKLLGLLELPGEKVEQKIGNDNPYFFTNEIALFVLEKIVFAASVQPLTASASASASAGVLIQIYYRLLSSNIFHNAAADVLFQHLQSLSSYQIRHAIVSQFLAGFFSEKFTFTMHTRKQLTIWALSPAVVGFPLPEFSVEFAAKAVEDEKLHLDIRRAILSSTVAYFKYQEMSNAGPVQTDALFAVLDKTITQARDSITPTAIWAIRPDLAIGLQAKSSAFQELLPPTNDPAKFAAIPGIVVAFPKTGEWMGLYGRYVSSFVGAGLLTGNSQLLLLVIAALTQLCTETTEVSSKIDPFIRNGLAQLGPGRPATVLLSFAFHFCFSRSSSVYGALIDQFVAVFGRLRAYVDEFIEEHVKDAFDVPKATESTVALNAYIGGFIGPLPELLQRAVDLPDGRDGEAEWIQALCKRIQEALKVSEKPKARIGLLDQLTDWIGLLGSDEIREAIPIWKSADAWRPILRLARRVDPSHPILAAYLSQAKALPIELLPEIADWTAESPRPGDATLMPFIRASVKTWLETGVESAVRDRVLSGLWRFSAL